MKAKLVLEVFVDIPMDSKEAALKYPDCLWPEEALALDKVSEIGLPNLVYLTESTVKDVTLYD